MNENHTTAKKKRSKLRFLLIIPMIIITLMLMMIIRFKLDGRIDYQVSIEGVTIPKFEEVEIDFSHHYDKEKSIQATGSAIIDLDNAGAREVFIGGGRGQEDALFRFESGAFTNISEEAGLAKETDEATLSAVSLDTDNDGDDDLIVSRSTSIWLYTNNEGKLKGEKLNVSLDDETSPLSIAVCDLNRDGHFDMYVCGYIQKEKIEGLNIFNKEGYGGISRLLINKGDNTFTDQTKSSGLFYKHNTFQAVFNDVDSDGDEDLVVAHDTGQVRTYRNLGNLKFENVDNPNSGVFSYPMGIAVSDYDNDGRTDFFFSNTGTTAPAFMARGDLRDDQVYHSDWIMFHNDGDFAFTDTAEKVKVADYEFSWGAVFEDFNLDGLPDLVVSENYVDLPPHKMPFLRLPGRFLIQNTNGEFAAVGAEAGVSNKSFGISPLTADLNLDGAPDLIHVNIAGKSRAFLSEKPTSGFVKVELPNKASSIGAIVKATLTDGKVLYRPFVKGEGLCSDSSPTITLGTGEAEVESIEVQYLGAPIITINDVKVGTTVVVE